MESWMDKPVYTTKKTLEKVKIPKGLWEKCPQCNAQHTITELISYQFVCYKCQYHMNMPIEARINQLCDQNSFKEIFKNYKSLDPLQFNDGKSSYFDKLSSSIRASGSSEAVITGTAMVNKKPIVLAIMNFKFIGGSMGSVVGEKIYQGMQFSIKKKIPFIVVTASGGARMQEGLLSLMQMAKTCIGAQELAEKKIPFIVIMTHPTMGGVTASFASVADIIIAEPQATIGFAGRRVIEDTTKEKLPENFQTSEHLYERGFIDMIVNREMTKKRISQIIGILRSAEKKHAH